MQELNNQLFATTNPLEIIELSDKILKRRLDKYIKHMFLKGEMLLSLGRYDDAITIFEQILEYHEDKFTGRAYNSIGFCYYMKNEPKKANYEFEKARKYCDEKSLLLNSATLNLAAYYSMTNQKEDTFKLFKELYDLNPINEHEDTHILFLTMVTNPEEYIEIYNQNINENFPKDDNVMVRKGAALINLKRFNEANAVFEDIVKYSKDKDIIGVAHTYLGYCYLRNNELDKAISEYEKAHEYSDKLSLSDKISMLESLAHIYEMANQTEKALEVLKELSEINPDNQNIKKKIKNLKREINGKDLPKDDNFNSIQDAILQAEIYSARNEYEKAIEVYDLIIDTLINEPDSAEIYKIKGLALINLNRFEEAIECYDKSLKINPNDFKAWNNKAFSLHNLNRLDEAIKYYDKSLKINPNYISTLNNKAFALRTLNRLDEAIECYDKTLKINPNDFKAWNNKAFSLHELNRSDEAIECYDKALKINPNYFEAWANKGFTLENLDRIDEAVECYNKALTLSPNNPDILNRLSFIKAKKNGSRIVDLYF